MRRKDQSNRQAEHRGNLQSMITETDIISNYSWTPDPRWDHKILNYDITKHNWSQWFFESIRELKPSLPKMEDIHLYFSTEELIGLRKHVERLTRTLEFSRRLDNFFSEYVSPLVDDPNYLIQTTSGIRIVVPDQEKKGRLLSFHTGYWTGYNNHMGTVWTPLTKAWGTNTMQVISWQDSIEIMKKIHSEKLSLEEIQSICIEKMYPTELEVGQSWLFNQGHLPGNVNNTTGITRVSFDARYALPGYDLGPRRAGSFFRLQGCHAEIDHTQIKSGPWVIFIDQNSEFIGETPHYMIREMLLEMAKRYKITVNEWSNEYWGCTWMPKLREYATNPYISGIMVPSIHAFSGPKDLCLELFETIIGTGKQIIFVDENLHITDCSGLDLVQRLYEIKR